MAGFGRPQKGAKIANQRSSCHPSVQLTIIYQQKLLIPPKRAIFLLTFYAEYFSEIKRFGHERVRSCSVLPDRF